MSLVQFGRKAEVHLTHRLQSSVSIVAIHTKIASCEVIIDSLLHLRETPMEKVEDVNLELDIFCNIMNNVQNALAKSLPFIKEIKTKKSSFGNVLKLVSGKIGRTSVGKMLVKDKS